MKETFYFSHDYNSRNDQKILTLRGKFGLEGYALFWMCVETMAEEKEACIHRVAIGGLSLGYGVAIAKLEEFLDYCVSIDLFRENDEKVYSERLVEHKKLREELSKFGKKGAEKRWQNYSPPNGNKGKERKGKENKDTIATDVADINHLLKLFEPVNPTLNYGNKTQRKALEELVGKFGDEKIAATIKYAVSVQGQKYAPTITTPFQLKEKMGALKVYYEKQETNNLTIAV